MPTSANENEDGETAEEGFLAPWVNIWLGLGSKGFGRPTVNKDGGDGLLADGVVSLTISCSPSSLIPISDSLAVSA